MQIHDLVRRVSMCDAGGAASLRAVASAAPVTAGAATREWLVTNGLGGYASGTVAGVLSRRFHGLLIAALPAPLGRAAMLSAVRERARLPGGPVALLSRLAPALSPEYAEPAAAAALVEFRLEVGLPVWRYELGAAVLERRVLLPHLQNTVHVTYRHLSGPPLELSLAPAVDFRPHEGPLDSAEEHRRAPYALKAVEARYELERAPFPPLRLHLQGPAGQPVPFTIEHELLYHLVYETERDRGYDSVGNLVLPGHFDFALCAGQEATLIASTESWETVGALSPAAAEAAELERRRRLLLRAPPSARSGPAAELILAADQFLITPAGRVEDAARAQATGDEVRTVIAGYHWFTDWGRDTMISLEGLTLTTGRYAEAGYIVRTFARYVRDGLVPNMFPEGNREGLYHTADATLWFFHAIDRYVETTGDRHTLRLLLPVLGDIIRQHLRGTRFGIAVDPADGLLRQGAEGYQLTWMDAKVDGWVVTPRRGKAVEINALWYNALRLLESWLAAEGDGEAAQDLGALAERARRSFNQRFPCPEGGYLHDVIDGEGAGDGADAACRPNQLLALSLRHPVLEQERWEPVLRVVTERLLTPVGLRSLSPLHPDYKARYDGDLRARDAAYHQGTVWAWLIGPYIDAWLRVYPERRDEARALLRGLVAHLGDACVGSVSEIFDAEPPFTARGCAAQAWSVAELLRCWVKTQE